VSTTLLERPTDLQTGANGGGAARRAIARWSWRLFRREWRQQVLVVALVLFAVAATTVGVALAGNAGGHQDATFGRANTLMTFTGSDPADVAAARAAFGPLDEIDHRSIAVPGSLDSLDLRAQDPHGKFGSPTLRLVSGQYPTGPDEIAMTRAAAATFAVHVGDRFVENGQSRRVVGLVENPSDLRDQFALVGPGQADPPSSVTILFDATANQLNAFRTTGNTVGIGTRSSLSAASAAAVVLALETIGLLFVGLVAAAGFAVMAQRRLRALGMLGALGATDRQVRFAMLANGAVVGTVGAIAGVALGLLSWIALAPRFEKLTHHRIDRFNLPWWALAAAMLLAILTAIVAAWWPARSASRGSIVAALSGRPAPPKPAHRFAGAGAIFLAAGFGCLAFADSSQPPNTFLIITGTVATTFGMLFLGPLFIRTLAAAGRRAPIALRLALRDLARYQARSAAALGAISLALAIAATVAVSAAALAVPPSMANLPANQAMVYMSGGKSSTFVDGGPAIPEQTAAETAALRTRVDALAASLHAEAVIPLMVAIDPTAPGIPISDPEVSGGGAPAPGAPSTGSTVIQVPATLAKVTTITHGGRHGTEITDSAPLYVATPALLQHYGIDATAIKASTDVITGRTDLGGLDVILPPSGPTPCDASQPNCRVNGVRPKGSSAADRPTEFKAAMQTVKLPTYSSAPDTLLTPRAVSAFGLQAVAAGWLLQTRQPLTTAQIDAAQRTAAAGGFTIETRKSPATYAALRNGATAIGLLVALGVLAMTVGLIRSETAGDLRTLAATGATSTTRRALTGATAGALALLGGLLGTGGAYLALIAWHRTDLHPLTRVPFVDLAIIIVGLPVIAITAGWVLAGREPASMAQQPLE